MLLLDKLKELAKTMNSKGIPLPMVTDPVTGRGSVTITMVVVSFGACLLLLLGKVSEVVGGTNYEDALWLLGISLGAYLGRKSEDFLMRANKAVTPVKEKK